MEDEAAADGSEERPTTVVLGEPTPEFPRTRGLGRPVLDSAVPLVVPGGSAMLELELLRSPLAGERRPPDPCGEVLPAPLDVAA